MAREVGSDLDFKSVARILNLLDPTLAQHPATKAYVDAAVEGLAWKDSVRAGSTANVPLTAPGANIDGVAMAANDRLLLKNQTAGQENGIYVWTGAAVALTRAPDANTAPELEQAITTVEEGTANAATTWRQTVVNFVLDTTPITFAAFGTAAGAATTASAGLVQLADQTVTDAGADATRAVTPATLANLATRKRKFLATIGDAAATSIVVTHNFNTRDVEVEVYRNSGNFDTIICDVNRTSLNAVTIVFAAAPALNAFNVVVLS